MNPFRREALTRSEAIAIRLEAIATTVEAGRLSLQKSLMDVLFGRQLMRARDESRGANFAVHINHRKVDLHHRCRQFHEFSVRLLRVVVVVEPEEPKLGRSKNVEFSCQI